MLVSPSSILTIVNLTVIYYCTHDGVNITLQVYFTPNIHHAIMTVVDSAKILTNTDTTTSSKSNISDDKKGNIPHSHITQYNTWLICFLEQTEDNQDEEKEAKTVVDKQSGIYRAGVNLTYCKLQNF